VGVRRDGKVKYVGEIAPSRLIIDFDLIRSAPPHRNFAGVGDVISCCSALGDWRLSHTIFEDVIDEGLFNQTVDMIRRLLSSAEEIHSLSDEGIQLLVEFLREECQICEKWGNSRPEEGGEHFLAYALEKIRPKNYVHGSLISLNVLIVLLLQDKNSVFTVDEVMYFLDKVGVQFRPRELEFEREDFKKALQSVQQYVKEENLFRGIWNLSDVFQRFQMEQILDWIYGF